MFNNVEYFTYCVLVMALASCGGGDDSAPAPYAPILEGNTGSVSALFVSTSTRYFFYGSGSEMTDSPVSYVQNTNGTVTEIVNALGTLSIVAPPGNKLPGNGIVAEQDLPVVDAPIIKEISGDEFFAMGRWSIGTATVINESTLLKPYLEPGSPIYTYFNGMHYLFMNRVSAFPTNAMLTCDTGHFTAGTFATGSFPDSYEPPVITGNASLSFDDTGAHFTINLHASINDIFRRIEDSGDQTYTGVVSTPSTLTYPNGALLTVGDGGNGSYLIAGEYRISTTAFGSFYKGMMVFRCQ